uniref:Uncharacterized protein n=1 Tax=Trepomonas sp. PC1 TaxID=1076344 RepID=A0A146KG58_9EUKA|eukprot:JAP95148.1 Hypothetical protein TPC1_11952 [Trepomonas sp. PC1]
MQTKEQLTEESLAKFGPIELPQACRYSTDSYDLYPERQKCMQRRHEEHLEQLEILFFDEFKQLDFFSQLKVCTQSILASSYHHFSSYPVLDTLIDWTSSFGVARDGIALFDVEMQLAYLFLPFGSFDFAVEQHFLVIKPFLNSFSQFEGNENVIENDTDFSIHEQQQKFLQKTSLKIVENLPMYPKIPKSGSQNHSQLMQMKLEQAKTQIHSKAVADINDQDKKSVRKEIRLKFLCKNYLDNAHWLLKKYSESPEQARNRSLKIQSLSQTELFKALYMNNSIKYCSKPSSHLLHKLNQINDMFFYKKKELVLEDFSFKNEEMTSLSVRSFVQALIQTLNYNPTRNCSILGNLYYQSGSGTPYDPFVPQNQQIIRNLNVRSITFEHNEFGDPSYIQELLPLFKCSCLRESLSKLVITQNFIKQNAAIMITDKLKYLDQLTELQLNYGKINSIGISCVLYLLNFNQVYVKRLGIAGSVLQTKNMVQQLGFYLKNCYQQYQELDYLDCSGCITTLQHALDFVKILGLIRIKEIKADGMIGEIVEILKGVAIKITV